MESPLRPADPTPVPLASLVTGLGLVGDVDSRVAVAGITLDSREVRQGWLYVAVPGSRAHGIAFAENAVRAGASAILTEVGALDLVRQRPEVPVVEAEDVRSAMAVVAARIFGEPARQMTMLGVTGTNGKTTTVALLQSALMAAGVSAGTIGTIGFRLGSEELPAARSTVTTPESPDLQALLAAMRERGAQAVALEVSSHALALRRADAITFDAVGFLNLGHDHLDFHHTVEDYFEAKARLFEPGRAEVSVIWIDDPRGRQLARRVREHGRSRLVTVGRDGDADYQLLDYRAEGALGGVAELRRSGEKLELRLSLPGEYNMIDAAVAFAMLEAVGIPVGPILHGLAGAQVPGRMQRVPLGEGAPLVVVDFAHTPQAVEAALASLAEVGTVISVVGCGGDRDPDKRGDMGAAAARGSRTTIITDDNPRTEDPAAIRAAVLEGARVVGAADVVEVAGRRAAIEEALRRAAPGDIVAILGKGHERGQILADRTVDFDDVEEASAAWSRLRQEGESHARA